MKDNKPKKQLNNFTRYSGIGFQMAVTIFIGAFIGVKLDEKYPNENSIFTLVFSLLFIFASLYIVIKQVTNNTD